jgi:superfamily I DNA/RNA helicase
MMVRLQKDYSDDFDADHVEFLLFDELQKRISDAMDGMEEDAKISASRTRTFGVRESVDFACFRDDIFPGIEGKSGLRDLVVWTQITSFLKGSVEAALAHRSLTLLEYLAFAKDRVHLSKEQRADAYAMFERYQAVLMERKLWDDGDRAVELFSRGYDLFSLDGLNFDRVYVDEVQDYTQAEMLLFLLSGATSPQRGSNLNFNSLFLAGDPVQAVREGVSFRFEDVRGIAFALNKLSGLDDRFDKPHKLTTKYRSHVGFLKCSDAVLGKLFGAFPSKSRELPPDTGLFQGPRPAFLNVHDDEGLTTLFTALPGLVAIVASESKKAEEEAPSRLASLTDLLGKHRTLRSHARSSYVCVLLLSHSSAITCAYLCTVSWTRRAWSLTRWPS